MSRHFLGSSPCIFYNCLRIAGSCVFPHNIVGSYYIQLLTPKAVARAVKNVIRNWTTVVHVLLLNFMVLDMN